MTTQTSPAELPMLPRLMPGAEPLFIRGSAQAGALVMHGFTASPNEVRWLAEALASAGLTVLAPRLAGHGTHYTDMARVRWSDWLASAQDAYRTLTAQCERVVVFGHSMGGMLALLLAAQAGADDPRFAGTCVLATPLVFKTDVRLRARYLQAVIPFTNRPDRSTLTAQIRDEQIARGEKVLGRVRYDRWSTSAVHQMIALAETAEASLPAIRKPLLLIYSSGDPTAAVWQGERIRQKATAAPVELRILERSGHILPQDVDRQQVFDWACAFAREQTLIP